MWRGGQDDLTRPYVERYFAELPATAEVRSGWVLALAAEAFFPLSHADEHTLALAAGAPRRPRRAAAVGAEAGRRHGRRDRAADRHPSDVPPCLSWRADPARRCGPGSPSSWPATSAPTRTGWSPRSRSRSGWPGRARRPTGCGSRCARPATTSSSPRAGSCTRASAARSRRSPTAPTPTCGPSRSSTSSPSPWRRHPTGPLAHQHPALSSGSSACGVCGRDTIDSAVAVSAAPWSGRSPRPRRRTPAARTCCASARPSSPAPAGCTPPASSPPPASRSWSARTSAGTTPSTRSRALASSAASRPPRRCSW